MELQDYAKILARRWVTLLVTVLVFVNLGLAYVYATPTQFAARSQIFFSLGSADSTTPLLDLSNFTQQRVKSYAEAATSPRALQPVIDELGLDTNVETLSRSIDVSVPLDTVLLDVVVTQPEAADAVAIARSHNASMLDLIGELEQPVAQEYPVSSSVLRDGVLDPDPIRPSPLLVLLLSGFTGVVLGVLLCVWRDTRKPFIQDMQDLGAIVAGHCRGTSAPGGGLATEEIHDVQILPAQQLSNVFLRGAPDGAPPRVVLVVGLAVEGEAAAVATKWGPVVSSAGRSVCLVDLDTTGAALARRTNVSREPGLLDALASSTAFADVATLWSRPGTWVLPSGDAGAGQDVGLAASQASVIISSLESAYDATILVGAIGPDQELTRELLSLIPEIVLLVQTGRSRKVDIADLLMSAPWREARTRVTIVAIGADRSRQLWSDDRKTNR